MGRAEGGRGRQAADHAGAGDGVRLLLLGAVLPGEGVQGVPGLQAAHERAVLMMRGPVGGAGVSEAQAEAGPQGEEEGGHVQDEERHHGQQHLRHGHGAGPRRAHISLLMQAWCSTTHAIRKKIFRPTV